MHNVLEVKNVTKTYKIKGTTLLANDDISFDLREGEILAVLGPNGAGKSTLIKQIIGYTDCDSGEITIYRDRIPVASKSMLTEMGYMMQSRFEHWDHLSIHDALYYSAKLRKLKKCDIEKEIKYLAKELDFEQELTKVIGRLSGGKKQAAALACSVIGNPSILILDEPTTGLDPEKKILFWNFLKKIRIEKKIAVLLITHNVDEVENIVDRVIILGSGKVIASGTVDELKKEIQGKVRIEFSPQKGLLINDLGVLTDKYDVKVVDNRVYFFVREDEVISCIADILQTNFLNETMEDLKVIRPSLEDIYIKIMGGRIA